MNLLEKNFNKTLKRFNKKPYGGTSYPTVNERGSNRWKKPMKQCSSNTEQKDRPRGIQYNDSYGEEDQEEKLSNFVAFIAQIEPPSDNSLLDESEDEGEMTEEELLEDYKLLYSKWNELTRIYTKVETERGRLKEEVEKLLKLVEDRDRKIKGLNVQ
ncbi:hypothetical protein LIER_33801 [Lithospermum erythrorhizon]|uniref:Uncharacterized protein n=1 Tax=Lithospermum erythrorhizon TaxID=34254 RepID=A0AAV3RXW1_LITER